MKNRSIIATGCCVLFRQSGRKTGPMSDLGLTQETINNAGTTLGVSGAKEAIRVQQEYIKTIACRSRRF